MREALYGVCVMPVNAVFAGLLGVYGLEPELARRRAGGQSGAVATSDDSGASHAMK